MDLGGVGEWLSDPLTTSFREAEEVEATLVVEAVEPVSSGWEHLRRYAQSRGLGSFVCRS